MSFQELESWDPMQDSFLRDNSSHKGHSAGEQGIFPHTCSLYVKNIPANLHQDALVHIFEKYGRVRKAFVKFRPNDSRTFGFVHFYTEEDAQSALCKIKRNNMFGLQVELARYSKNYNENRLPCVPTTDCRTNQPKPILPANQYNDVHQETGDRETSEGVTNDSGQAVLPLEIICSGSSRSVAVIPSPPLPHSVMPKNKSLPMTVENQSVQNEICRNKYISGHGKNSVLYSQPERGGECILNGSRCAEECSSDDIQGSTSYCRRKGLATPPLPVSRQAYCSNANSECGFVDIDAAAVFPKKAVLSMPKKYCASAYNLCCDHHEPVCDSRSHSGHRIHSCNSHSSTYNVCMRDCCSVPSRVPRSFDGGGDDKVYSSIPQLGMHSSPCSYCGKRGSFICTVCSIPYCSRECQVADWPDHAKVCKTHNPYCEAQSNVIGQEDMNQMLYKKELLCRINSNPGSHILAESEFHAPSQKSQTLSDAQKKLFSQMSSINLKNFNNFNQKDIYLRQNQVKEALSSYSNAGKVMHASPNQYDRDTCGQDLCKIRGFKGDGSIAKNSGIVDSNLKDILNDLHSRNALDTRICSEEMGDGRISKESYPFNCYNADDLENSANILIPMKMKADSIKMTTLSCAEIEKVAVCYTRSPTEFWIHRLKDADMLTQVETAMSELIKNKIPFQNPAIDDLCASLYIDNKLYRCRITKVESDNTCTVYYIDYGNTAVTKVSDLCYLSGKLTTYPALAVCCELADIKPPSRSDEWQNCDVELFTYLVDGKILKACVLSASVTKCTVDLVTEDGLTISSILVNAKNAEWISSENKYERISSGKADSDADVSLVYEVPSVIKKLTINTEVFVAPVFSENTKFAGWVNNQEVLKEMKDLEVDLQSPKSSEITETVEEGDIAIAFSPTYQVWYRSLVLKRMKTSIKVRYIDYGNEEEVTRLFRISSRQMNVCSPLLFFEIDKLPGDISKKILAEGFRAIVKLMNENFVEFSVSYGESSFCLHGSPWYYGLSSQAQPTPTSENVAKSKVNKNALAALEKLQIIRGRRKCLSMKELQKCKSTNVKGEDKNANNTTPFPIAADILVEREISFSSRTPVVVTWAKCKTCLFVQKVADIKDLQTLSVAMDKWCNSVKSDYVPVEGEIVCAKYSVDKKWYRSQVLKVLPKSKFYVSFIDFGNEESVCVGDIQKLSKAFSCPRFSIQVKLCDVPTEISGAELADKLSDKILDLEVVNSMTTPKEVVLYEMDKKIFPAELNSEVSVDKKAQASFKAANTKLPVLKKSFLEDAEVALNTHEKSKLAPVTLPPASSNVFLLPNCKFIDFPLGETPIIIYSITSFDVIFCAPFVQANISSNTELLHEINSFCNDPSISRYRPTAKGEMVLAKYPDDDCWYRAAVIDINENKFTVCFVDYGGMACVADDQIKRIESQFMELPIQAHVCKLGGVLVEKADAVNELLKSVPTFTALDAHVSKDDDIFIIDILLLKKQLLQMGLVSQ